MKYKLYEGTNLQEAMNKLLEDKAKPVSDLKVVWDWKQKHSPDKWVDSGLVFQKGVIRPITLKECKDLKELCDKDGRLLFLGANYDYGLGGYFLGYCGRFLGVKK